MKNVTVSVDDESFRRGRVKAAEMGKTLSAVVREFLSDFGSGETGEERGRRELREMFDRFDRDGIGVDTSNLLTREEANDRDRARRDAEEIARG